ncbi:hypothetical protein ACT4UM_05895, partial [Bacillus sp. SS-TM]
MFAGLDEQAKEKAKSILEQEKSGKLTREQAKEELTKLGVKMPEKGKHGDMFANLDEQTKEKAKSILEQKKSGKLTHEQAKEELIGIATAAVFGLGIFTSSANAETVV